MNSRWRKFVKHLGSYVIIIGMLALINLMTLSGKKENYGPGIAFISRK